VSLYLFPDRILVCDSAQVAAINYKDVNFVSRITRFIEDEALPRDAKVVDHTWRFVNKNGDPDRRFNNNTQLPICEYEETEITSESGFREIIQSSRHGIADLLRDSFRMFVKGIEDDTVLTKERFANSHLTINVSEGANPENDPSPSIRNESGRPEIKRGNHYHCLFRLLNCIAKTDGRVTENERAKIAEILNKAGSKWSQTEIDQLMSEALSEIEAEGLENFTAHAIEGLKVVRDQKQAKIFRRCAEIMFQAKGVLSDKEIALKARIYDNLDRS
jgi:uncharacterized tellurite resistance protein B-like protein